MEDAIDRSPKEQSPSKPARRRGGWRAIKYILANESFEKLASMSLIANMTVYLQSKYNVGGVFNVNVTTIWSGTSNIATLVGAFLADAYLGKFYTLLFGCISSLLGMLGMTLTASVPQLRPSACHSESNCSKPQQWQLGVLFVSLGFLSIGAGGIRPCNIAFGADQFDTTTRKGRSQLESFFNWWYFSFTIALVIALTAVVYIQTYVSWVLGFAIPTSCLFISISLFLIGRHTYIYQKPQGSVFVDMAKVIIAACRKRRLNTESDLGHPYYDHLDVMPGSQTTRLAHTDRFRFFDKAAMIANPNELDSRGMPKNAWRLCSLQQVEQLKCLVSVLPVLVSGIACFIAMDQQNAFGTLQAIQMNKSVGSHFKIPPGWMNLTSMIALSIWIFVYERIYVVHMKKTGKGKRLTMQQRIKAGIVMSILCMLVAAIVEKQRRDSALKHGTFASPLTVAILFPQFVLAGLIEAFAAVAIMEFLTTQMPDSMRTLAGAVFFLGFSIGSYLSSFLVNVIHLVTGRRGKSPWLGGHDLNKSRLDYYYYMIAALGVLNLIYFNFFASRYASDKSYFKGMEDAKLENLVSDPSRYMSRDEMVDEEKGPELQSSH